jgi:hypothetical protein
MSDIKVGKRLPHQRLTGLIVFLLFFPRRAAEGPEPNLILI